MGKKGGGKKGKKAKAAKPAASASAKGGKAVVAVDPKLARKLPNKEATLFKAIVKQYETKQYKKALKAADQILKKHPNHGETLAMKGLTLNATGKKEEALEFVKLGLRNDMRSHICWHVYGLFYRADRDYNQAIKCYMNALRIDTENKQILTDLALLQVQMRNVKGYVDSRRRLLTMKPALRNNWIGFAISHHLRGNLEMAINILNLYESTLEDKEKRGVTYEESEMVLYKNQVVEEIGDLGRCLEHLDSVECQVQDKMGWQERRASLLLRMGTVDAGKYVKAQAAYKELVEINDENYAYHRGYMTCMLKSQVGRSQSGCELPIHVMEVDGPTRAALAKEYHEWSDAKPRCNVLRRILLDVLEARPEHYSGETFTARIEMYLQRGLQRGVPALFGDVRPLYEADKAKGAIIEKLVEDYLASLRAANKFPGAAEEAPEESPDTLCWTLMFAAQQHDFFGDHVKALELIDEAIAHTPTALDLYRVKARIVKHAGDVVAASTLVERAREMDLADRYINTKSVKYLLRSHQVPEAEKVVTLFTKHDYAEPLQNLFDMQVMWYELECAETHERMGDYGRALKQFTSVETHFRDIREDQFDFHTYCLRKMTLRSYIQMIRMEDRIHGHRFFVRAAQGMARCYQALHEINAGNADENAEPDYSTMTPQEKKKAKQIARKAAQKKAKLEEELRCVCDDSFLCVLPIHKAAHIPASIVSRFRNRHC